MEVTRECFLRQFLGDAAVTLTQRKKKVIKAVYTMYMPVFASSRL